MFRVHPKTAKPVLGLAALAALTALAGSLWMEWSRFSGKAVLAADASTIRKMCRRYAYPSGDFLERLKAMGVESLWSPGMSLREIALEGGLLYFPKEEVEKWKMIGFLPPSTSLKPHSLWVLNPALAAQVLDIFKDSGVLVSTQNVSGYWVFNFSQSVDIQSFRVDGDKELRETAQSMGMEWLGDGPASLCRAESGPGLKKEALNLVQEHGCRVVAVSFNVEDGVEEGLARLREAVRAVKKSGFVRPRDSAEPRALQILRILLAVLLGCVSPWAVLRLSRRVLAACKESSVLEILSPVREIAAGFLAAAGGGVFCGLVLHVLLAGAADFSPEIHRVRAWWLILPFVIFLKQEARIGSSDFASFFKAPVFWKHLAAPALAVLVVFQPEASAAFLGFPALALGLWRELQGRPSKVFYALGLWGIVYAMDASSLPHQPFWVSLHQVFIPAAKGAAASLLAVGLWHFSILNEPS